MTRLTAFCPAPAIEGVQSKRSASIQRSKYNIRFRAMRRGALIALRFLHCRYPSGLSLNCSSISLGPQIAEDVPEDFEIRNECDTIFN